MKRLVLFLIIASVILPAQELVNPSFLKANRVPLIASGVASTTDTVQTCMALSRGAHEDFMPTQSCGGTVVLNTVKSTVFVGTSYLLYRANHRKLSKIVLYIGGATSAIGVGYSVNNFWAQKH